MVEPGKHLRNAAIILVLAAAVWKLPGGGTTADTLGNLLSVVLLGGLLFFGYRLYMEHRETLLDLPERARVILYASAGLAVFAIAGTSKMWNAGGPLILVWFALIGLATYGVITVVREQRQY